MKPALANPTPALYATYAQALAQLLAAIRCPTCSQPRSARAFSPWVAVCRCEVGR